MPPLSARESRDLGWPGALRSQPAAWEKRVPRWPYGLWRDLPREDRGKLRGFAGKLGQRYGPFDGLGREYAELTVELWWTARQSSRTALVEEGKRRRGKGRRPTLQQLDRRLKRQALAVGTLDQLVRRLEELASPRAGGRSLAAVLGGRRGKEGLT
jgi:hypothetical protein